MRKSRIFCCVSDKLSLKQGVCILRRSYTAEKLKADTQKYTATVNLPKTTFPSRLSASKRTEIDQQIQKNCGFQELYAWQRKNLPGPDFVLHDGPPYANGDLHIGHAVNKILKDVTIRHRVISGQRVHFVPGWDCHGLPIELKVIKDIKTEVESFKLREKARNFALESVRAQQESFKSWGIMANWENSNDTYRTIDKSYIQKQLLLFLELYEKGYIYQDLKPVHWSPASRTALAESELIYDENYVSPSLYFRVELKNTSSAIANLNADRHPIYALIWTTTPWTLVANKAVCYNPDIYYSLIEIENVSGLNIVATDLISPLAGLLKKNIKALGTFKGLYLKGSTYLSPLTEVIQPFLEGNHVTVSKGTGLVHTAPSHGAEDFLVAKKHNIDLSCVVDEHGRYTKEVPNFLRGLDVINEGSTAILNNENVKKNILHFENIIHSYPLDWRTNTPVILRASNQWFIDTESLKKRAIDALEEVAVYPTLNNLSNTRGFINQIEKRPYWCISRQRSWGVPIPALYDKKTNQPLIKSDLVYYLCEIIENEGNIDSWWTKSLEELVPKFVWNTMSVRPEDVYKGNDILDIWLDSGSSWLGVLGREQVADLYLEGVDQFRGWFQSSLLTSVALRGKAPYKNIFVHGFTVDEKGLKMSKSLGNVINPEDITRGTKEKPALGVDTLRWWVANHATQHALIPVSDTLLKASADSLQRLRVVLKFLLGASKNSELVNISELGKGDISFNQEDDRLKWLDKYMFHTLYEFNEKINSYYEAYEYNRVCTYILNFVANPLSGLYLHVVKDRLYCDTVMESQGTQLVLASALGILCRALWPIAPHLVEEAWSYYEGNTLRAPFYVHPPHVSTRWYCPEITGPMELAFEIRAEVNNIAPKQNTWLLTGDISLNERNYSMLKILHPEDRSSTSELCDILQLSHVTLKQGNKYPQSPFQVNVSPTNLPLCPRCRRHSVNDVQMLCMRCDNVVNNIQQ